MSSLISAWLRLTSFTVLQRLASQLQSLRRTDSSTSSLPLSTQVDAMIVLDRSADWVTPMCTQLTYEGLIDETMGIKSCKRYHL